MSAPQSGESASTILVSCKQTRFHIEAPVYQELDIQGLSITVTSASGTGTLTPTSVSSKKGKAKSEGLEILNNATLKLKPGVCYALVGRNGTGKSTLLRAIAEKLIPGIPLKSRIAILQQTERGGDDEVSEENSGGDGLGKKLDELKIKERSVLEEVIEKAISRDDIQREIDILSAGADGEDAYAWLRAFRKLHHERLKKDLFEHDKDARLRSGARGAAARKALIAMEKKFEMSAAKVDQIEAEIDSKDLAEETEAAQILLAELQAQLEPTRIADIEVRARAILTGLGFPKARFDQPVSTLSGGWLMRCSLATVLLQETDILILDEPTNFLDLLGIMWLQRFLLNLSETTDTTVLLVSHDRDFIDAVCPETILLRDRTLNYFRGTFSAYEKDRRMQILHLSRMQEAQDRQKAHIEKTIAQNMKAGKAAGDENKLRQAKSRQKKLDDRWGMSVSAKGGRFKLNRDITGFHLRSREEIDIPTEERSIAIFIPPAPDLRFPGPLISLENVSFRYPISKTKGMSKTEAATAAAAQKDVLTDVTLTIHAGDRIGVLGLNGSGKSTLINLITGATTPSKGTASFHPRLRMGYYSQHAVTTLQTLGATNPSLTALAHLTALTSTSASAESESQFSEQDLRGLLGSLGLPGRIASDIPIAKLSGGQLVRLALAELLWKEPQILVLDEVSTHLDFYTVDALGAALGAWNGAVVLVSHDRSFVRRVVEGVRDEEEESDEEQEEDAEGEVPRRREVFLMKGGKMTRLSGGVSEFEKSLERRIAKLSLG